MAEFTENITPPPEETSQCDSNVEEEEDFINSTYPFYTDVTSGSPVHYLTLFLKYFAPVELVHDVNLQRIIEGEIEESVSRSIGGKELKVDQQVLITGSSPEGLTIPDYIIRKTGTLVDTSDKTALIAEKNYYQFDLPLNYAEYMQGKRFRVENLENSLVGDTVSNYGYIRLTDTYLKACSLLGLTLGDTYVPNRPPDMCKVKNEEDLSGRMQQDCSVSDADSKQTANYGDKSFKNGMVSSSALNVNSSKHYIPQAIHFTEWPNMAAKWMVRDRRSGWPDPVVRLEVIQAGYHMLPISSSENTDPEQHTEWKYSFSAAEKILGQSITKVQRQVFVLFKLLMTFNINTQGALVSEDVLKSVFFYKLEDMPVDYFKENNVCMCVFALLDELAVNMAKKQISHYFIPEINLIKNISSSDCKSVYKHVRYVRSNLIGCIADIANQVEFFELKGMATFQEMFDCSLRAIDTQSNDYDQFIACVNDALVKMIRSYVMLMHRTENNYGKYQVEKTTKLNMLTELCSQGIRDLQEHYEVVFPSDLHFLIYALSKEKYPMLKGVHFVIGRMMLGVCSKVGVTKECVLNAMGDIAEYCRSVSDIDRVENVSSLLVVVETLAMPDKDKLDNNKVYVKSFANTT